MNKKLKKSGTSNAFYINYEECKCNLLKSYNFIKLRFILTMRNVNKGKDNNPNIITNCFILTMRNVNQLT